MSIEDDLRQAVASNPSVRLLVLFGSRARGSSRPTSDADVGISLTDPSVRSVVEAALSRAAGRSIDIVDLETSPPQLRFEIARDGMALLERDPHAWPDFRARAMVDWWDWAPTARRLHAAALSRLRAGAHGPA